MVILGWLNFICWLQFTLMDIEFFKKKMARMLPAIGEWSNHPGASNEMTHQCTF